MISTFYIDDIFDFLEDNKIKVIDYTLTQDKFQYKIVFNIDKTHFNNIVNDLINFTTGRFITTSIYIKTDLDAWIKLWKNNIFYNMDLLK